MPVDLIELPWLAAAPADFSARCRALPAEAGDAGPQLQQLATFRLSSSQAISLGRALAKLTAAGRDLAPLAPVTLAIVSNATMDFVADHLAAGAARHGVALCTVLAEFDTVMQEALDPASRINSARADLLLLAIDHRWLGLSPFDVDPEGQVQAAVERVLGAARLLKRNSGAALILPLLATPHMPLFGNFERRARGSLAARISRVNEAILRFAEDEGVYILDVDGIAASVGTAAWFDPVAWNGQKQPFAASCNPLYADRLGALLGAIRGKARKCLVLDLDNTLWGGVIGDDGLGGIVLGPGSAAGEAFLEVQRIAAALKARGVVLAVASKNNDETARSAFREHKEMLLREADIAVFQANWTDKASNLEAIAAALSIGLDALVLLDDNPAERAQLRAALPTVAVPELPNDSASFGTMLLNAGYFEAVSFGADDALRAASYGEDVRRAEVQAKSRDLGDYLRSLDMVLTVGPFDAADRARVTQLVNKTNQFNLLTRRRTESEVTALEGEPAVLTLQARLRDAFGDMGLISVVTCLVRGMEAEITDWLMSCRVLGRQIEEATYGTLMTALADRGVVRLRARYAPTRKNEMVREHYDRLGMTLLGQDAGGARDYEALVADYRARELPVRVEGTLSPSVGVGKA